MKKDPAFSRLKVAAQNLTPYAVEARYDDDFWPTVDTATQPVSFTSEIKDFVIERLPRNLII